MSTEPVIPRQELRRFGLIPEVLALPKLVELQLTSFDHFLQKGRAAPQRLDIGLHGAFREIFPIDETDKNKTGGLVLDFLEYEIGTPKFNPEQCRDKDLTYQAPLYAKLQLIHRDTGLIKEDKVFLGDLPLMTEEGSFVVNGADRVLVSQIHRSPGVYFVSGAKGSKSAYQASIIPMPKRGPWIEIEFSGSGILEMKINKKKFPVTMLMRVLGYNDEAMKKLFTGFESILDSTYNDEKSVGMGGDEALLRLFAALRPGDPPKRDKAIQYIHALLADPKRYDLGDAGRWKMNRKLGLNDDYKTLIVYEDNQFKDVGLVSVIRYLLALEQGRSELASAAGVTVNVNEDDIDHLGNRRVRTVGELLADQFRVGLGRMARGVRERMLLGNPDAATPQKLVNNRPIVAAMREFFGRSQLSQFKDQTNPLAELRHKRRISALGPGGLTRERAGFDVRDVHRTHYGRICPIETPEGSNIGLISSLASYAKVNPLGFIEAPYRKVENSRIVDEILYLTADDEDRHVVAQANTETNDDGTLRSPVLTRRKGDPFFVDASAVTLMDVSPKQIISVSTSLIPFLEHDDANRALMGSNMQSQAVPLVRVDPPVVGTGIEEKVVRDSGSLVLSDVAGIVTKVDGAGVQITQSNGNVRDFQFIRFVRSNYGTNIDQKPIVHMGQEIEVGQVLADGPASFGGRLGLGQNITIAIMPFDGYNYEDAICMSEALVRKDFYTSIHIEKHEKEARETKLGPEKITRDIPGLSEAALRDLDEEGIVRMGAEVKQGDILVGHTSFKGETEPTPEERLLRSIFGEKAREVKDTSLRVPSGEGGTVIRTIRFRRGDDGVDLKPGVREMVRIYVAQRRKLQVGDKLANRHGNKGVVSKIMPPEDMPYLPDGTPVDLVFNPLGVPSRMNMGQIFETHLGEVARRLGVAFITPVFDSATEKQVKDLLEATTPVGVRSGKFAEALADPLLHNIVKAEDAERITAYDLGSEQIDLREEAVFKRAAKLGAIDPWDTIEQARAHTARTGKTVLFDGRTGEAIDGPIVVGTMYVMKLYHMVEDKMHARSTGPYSLITQQPLGGKAQMGGQRFGEMEVWALEAYGAAHTLQEILTLKSDDIEGRDDAYQAIVKGDEVKDASVPESFKVLVKELHSLGLDVEVLDSSDKNVDIFEGMLPRR
jgi:DNA-directed RNA polymerase subunit beta